MFWKLHVLRRGKYMERPETHTIGGTFDMTADISENSLGE